MRENGRSRENVFTPVVCYYYVNMCSVMSVQQSVSSMSVCSR